MNDEIKIWEIDDPKEGGRPVESIDQTDTENALEEALVKSPDMLMQGLTLVGRQTPTDSGNLDLLGVDDDGRLVVFELKRGKLTRDAIVQIVDYCSWLESLTETELAKQIASRSGTSGVDKIDDFETWYGIRRGKPLVELKPIRMVLVGDRSRHADTAHGRLSGREEYRHLAVDVSRVQTRRQNTPRETNRGKRRGSRDRPRTQDKSSGTPQHARRDGQGAGDRGPMAGSGQHTEHPLQQHGNAVRHQFFS